MVCVSKFHSQEKMSRTSYDHLLSPKVQEPLYPLSIRAFAETAHSDEILKQSVRTAIPEFIRFNIVENEVRDVC